MSGTLESLRRKIDGAGDLEGVVRSMKALAASSIGQYEKAVQSLDDYYRTVELALVACLRQAGPVSFAEGKRPPHERRMKERSAQSCSVRTRVLSAGLTRWSWNSPCTSSERCPAK